MVRRAPIPIKRIASLAAVGSAGGVIGGTFARAKAHFDFFRNLDNQPAFFQAIDNIQSRLDEKPDGQDASSYPSSDNENQEMADGAVISRGPWEESNRATLSPNPSIVTRPMHYTNTYHFVFIRRFTTFPTQEPLGRDPSGTCAHHGDTVFLG